MKRHHREKIRHGVIFGAGFGFLVSGLFLLWAATLPMPDLKTFEERRVEQSTKLYDRTGEILLYDLHQNVRRTVVPFGDISRHLKNATIAIEDAEFYEHRGVKPTAIIRAILVNLGTLNFSQGGSTITQQVVKNSILTPKKEISRKLKEWVLSVKLEGIISKDEILGLYLNEAPYGGNLYGAEEASRAFFGKSAKDLSLVESAYLASLPQAPTYYSPYGNNAARLEERKNLVLSRMHELGFISDDEYTAAKEEKVSFLPQAVQGIRAPHFVFFVREYLEQKYGKELLEKSGLKVITTLDATLEETAEKVVREYGDENVEKYNAHNAGLVAIDPKTGHILAMVGSRDYFGKSEPEGCASGVSCAFDPQVNTAALTPGRQPGSAFKPFVYATAFMKGFTPKTVVFDLKTQFHSGCDTNGKPLFPSVKEDECYMPENYDHIYRGPVTFRDALAQSINIPAIKVLYLAGIKESLATAKKMGISSLKDPDRYGLTLVLGGGEVSLLEMTSAYGVFANEGVRNPPIAILRVEDSEGRVLEEFAQRSERVIPEEAALLISDVLSDNEARTPAFGEQSFLYFPDRDVAAKTGTTNDYRDAWIVGYAPNLAVGAWVGNNDNSPMEKKVAGFIVAPLWHAFMGEALKTLPPESFRKPREIDERDLPPMLRGQWLGGESYFTDKISGKLATEYTPEELRVEHAIANVHSILFWIHKNAPLGGRPEHPEDDPQFILWETPVRKWVAEQGIREGTPIGMPKEYDSVHRPEYAPRLSIEGIRSDISYGATQKMTFTVKSSGAYPLARVDVFLNNVYVGSSKVKPFAFSFVPNDTEALGDENVLKIAGYDSVMNMGEAALPLQIR